jgi:hypothetical protein
MELMEDRCVLTPIAVMLSVVEVQVTGGDLVLTGNSAPNEVVIQQTNSGGLRVDGWSGPGQPTYLRYNNRLYQSLTMSGVTDDVRIDLNAGNDAVWFGSSYQHSAVPDDLNIYTDDGVDVVALANISMDDLLIDTGNQDDFVYTNSITVGPPVLSASDAIINTGNGSDDVTMAYCEVGRDVTINTGADGGHDEVTLLGLIVRDDLSIATNAGMDQVSVDASTIQDVLSINTGADADDVYLLLTAVDELFETLGSGDDRLHLERMTARRATLYGGTGTVDELDLVDNVLSSATISGFEL